MKKMKEKNLARFTQTLVDALQAENRFSTAAHYSSAVRNYLLFIGQKSPGAAGRAENVGIDALSQDNIAAFNRYLLNKGLAPNTVSFYNRVLRAIWNKAVRAALVPRGAANPFEGVYTGNWRTCKRAIAPEAIQDLSALDAAGLQPQMSAARDIFLFSFYTMGMSFVDIAHLRRTNLDGDTIRYTRRKTGQQMCVKIIPEIRSLLDRNDTGGEYLFPLIRSGSTPGQAYAQYASALTGYNRHLKKLGEMAGGIGRISSYTARHSWATIARDRDIPVAVISQALGHTSEKTTRTYLADIDFRELDKANRLVAAEISACSDSL